MSRQKIFEIIHVNDSSENTQEEEMTIKNTLSQKKNNSKYIFMVSKNYNELLRKKRGRPSRIYKKNPELNHNKYKIDNIRIKIKTHYHSFIIGFFNDLIKLKFKIQRYKFRKIPYSITKDVTIKTNLSLKYKTIGELLSNDISDKYKKYESGKNRKSVYYFYKTVKDEEQKNLLSKTYKDFFYDFFLNGNREELNKKYGTSSKTILFSEFCDTITDNKYKEMIIYTANNYFLDYFYDKNEKKNEFIKKKIALKLIIDNGESVEKINNQ
jgi:hypothetical protein